MAALTTAHWQAVSGDAEDAAAGRDTSPNPEVADPEATSSSVVDLYRSIVDAGRELVVRRRLDIWLEVALIVAFVVLRSLDWGRRPLTIWFVVAGIVALVAPVSGLVLLAAIAPFSESVILTHELGMNPVLLLVVAVSILIRVLASIVLTRRIPRPPRPLVMAALLAAVTALGIVVSNDAFGSVFATAASQIWLAGIGGGLTTLGMAYWVARRGILRPFVVVVGATVVGGIASLVEYFDPATIRSSVLDWMVRGPHFTGRLAGVISSPNGVASVVIVAAAVLIGGAALGPDRRIRAAAAVAAVPLVVALYLTYSRAALLGLFATAVVVAWRFQRRIGIALLILGLIGGAVLLPRYLESRFAAAGDASAPIAGGLLVASDQERLTAWGAAGRMWLDSPLIGHGFGSYAELGPTYGDEILNSPHSEWFRLFAEEGLVGGLIGLGFAVSVLFALARAPGWLGAGAFAAALGYFIAACFNNPFLFLQVGVPAYLVIGTGLGWAARASVPRGSFTGDGDEHSRQAEHALADDPHVGV